VSELTVRVADGMNARIASTCVLAATLAAAAWVAGSPRLAILSLFGVIAASIWMSYVGARPALVAACLVVAPPGLLGENYGRIGFVALALLLLCVWSAPAERGPLFQLAPVLIFGEALAFAFAAETAGDPAVRHTQVAVAALYALAAVVAFQLSKRPSLARDALRALTLLVAFTCVSYGVSVLTGFVGAHEIALHYRTVTFAPPLTLTGGNAANYLSTPRFLTLGSEPGLGGVFLLIASAATLVLERGRRRIVLLSALAVGVVGAQSTGVLIALGAMVCAAAFVVVTKRVAFIVATALLAAALPVALAITNQLVARKERIAPLSITDRGLAGSAGGSGISLSAAWSHTPALVVPLVALLGYFAIRSIRDPVQLGLVAAVSVTAWFAQPLQYHPGVWLMMLLVLAAPYWATEPAPQTQGVSSIHHDRRQRPLPGRGVP
jgi:hypothetical protein